MTWLAFLGVACSSPDGGHANDYQLEGTGAELYEEILVPPLFGPWADDLIARADVAPGQDVLDVATGTGIVARRVAEVVGPGGSVTGLDISPGMLSVAREAPAPEAPEIRWVEGSALELPFEDSSFDVVLCQQGLQFFPDRAVAVREMQRVLRPGGRVAVSTWRAPEHNPYGEAFARVVGERVSAEARAEATSPFGWDDADELRSLLSGAGLRDVSVQDVTLPMTEADLERFIINDLLAYPLIGTEIEGWDVERKDALVAEIRGQLETYRGAGVWVMPWSSNVGLGTR